ncbi:WD40 repeat-like protein [Trichoderma citrinoviride]|uniref:WD40 repeat-like protein n=1 Tax=Trichoderma citrinoviride TaxID=58853 RepID=A0A2T4BNC8_9HYPO|nr:WD40 repeat-like protein [Trichoderma citrinoviride]PTB70786.1 WD40 repeat-like protein [Trichoderma citrinoviride]
MSSLPQSPTDDENRSFDLNLQHGHRDLVQAIAFNAYGDRCATGSVDGKIRVFNRHRDGTWRLCDTWSAHGGEVVELQWLPSTIYPNLIASLGIEGWFRLWAENPSAAPGRRFCAARSVNGRPAFDTRSARAPYRSFSMKHNEETRQTYLALLATDGRLTVYENDQPENLAEYASIDEFSVCARPSRGDEVAFKVRFDPNPEPCYAALRAGVPADALGLVVAAMGSVKVYRTREVAASNFGANTLQKEFYLAADISGHRGLVRDVAWAPGNIRGYDMIATACQDGYARVFRIDTPFSESDGRSWSATHLLNRSQQQQQQHKDAAAAGGGGSKDDDTAAAGSTNNTNTNTNNSNNNSSSSNPYSSSGHHHTHHPSSTLSASLAKSSSLAEQRAWTGQPGQIRHTAQEMSRLDSHRTPVWRVGFDDDGQILGSTGDDGRLLCYRQTPDGRWAKSSELVMMKTRMAAP